jgi:squalene-hopene/tetraprenyl-beta-curcumene cyclase
MSIAAAIDRAVRCLQTDQVGGNHWVGRLSSSARATALAAIALHLTGSPYKERIERGRRWLRENQQADGGWGDADFDAANLRATTLALAAFRLTGDESPASAAVMAGAEHFLVSAGGFGDVRDPDSSRLGKTSYTIAALAGLVSWEGIRPLRPELILLPQRWRRKVSFSFPGYLSLALVQTRRAPALANRLPTYRLACERALGWLGQACGPDGSSQEAIYTTANLIISLISAGRKDVPWLRGAIDFLLATQREDGSWPIVRDLETFDTDMVVFALTEAGAAIPQTAAVRAWLLARQFTEPCFATGTGPGGWAWAMPSGWPDADDTAYTLLALLALGEPAASAAIQHGLAWLEMMQNREGSWPTLVPDSLLGFDRDCPYISGHVLSALQACGRLAEKPGLLDRALGYLTKVQRPDGSFASIWFREHTAGPASVLEALADCGLLNTDLAAGARLSLCRNQNEDGGWAGARGQASTAEETAWATLALLRLTHEEARQAAAKGIAWLIDHQRADGTWRPAPIGLYSTSMWYSNSYYALSLPLQALARAQRAAASEAHSALAGV